MGIRCELGIVRGGVSTVVWRHRQVMLGGREARRPKTLAGQRSRGLLVQREADGS
jgi:hypothetical protein